MSSPVGLPGLLICDLGPGVGRSRATSIALDGAADGPYLRGINLPRATLGGDERVDVLGRLLFPRRLGDEI